MNGASQAYRVYAVLVGGYIVSQFYRVSNAAIAPEMMRTLHLSAEEMGTLTGMFFLAFGLMQIPTGMLLDRFGPRYTMSGLLVVAAAGSAIFASAAGLAGLSFGRALMGVGCAAGLMGSMVVIGRWFRAQRFSPLSSLLFTVGGVGTLLATTPLAALSASIGWRAAFWLMAGATLAVAALLYAFVRDTPEGHASSDASPETLREIVRGLGAVLANRQLLHVSAIQFVSYAATLAVVGLWAGPYLHDIQHLDALARGNVLLALNVAVLVGVLVYSAIERWLGSLKWTIVAGASCSIGLLLALALVPRPPLALAIGLLLSFALASSYVMLNHAHARAVLPSNLVGRGLTMQNLSVFLGVAVVQSVSGVIIGQFSTDGVAGELAYRMFFGFLAGVVLVGLFFYVPARDVRPE